MPQDEDQNRSNVNPIFSAALRLFSSIAPNALHDPEKALRHLIPTLRFLIVERIEKPSIAQLKALQSLDTTRNLVQARKAIQASDLLFGPFPSKLAERNLMPALAQQGLSVKLRELTPEEQAKELEHVNNPPPYFRG